MYVMMCWLFYGFIYLFVGIDWYVEFDFYVVYVY